MSIDIFQRQIGGISVPEKKGGIHFVESNEGILIEDAIVDNMDDALAMVLEAEENAKKRSLATAQIIAARKEKERLEAELEIKKKKKSSMKRAGSKGVIGRGGGADSGDGEDGDEVNRDMIEEEERGFHEEEEFENNDL